GGGSCEDPPPDGIQVERPMDDAGVPARRVNGDLRFLLDYRDSAVVAAREPIRERGPEDPATDDRDVPGFHSPISRKCREFIMSVYLQRKRRAATLRSRAARVRRSSRTRLWDPRCAAPAPGAGRGPRRRRPSRCCCPTCTVPPPHS